MAKINVLTVETYYAPSGHHRHWGAALRGRQVDSWLSPSKQLTPVVQTKKKWDKLVHK